MTDDAQRRQQARDVAIETPAPRWRHLESRLALFHEQAAIQPELWLDSSAAVPALRTAFELHDVEYESFLWALQESRRNRHASFGAGQTPNSDAVLHVGGDTIGPQLLRAFESYEAYYNTIDQLRSSSDREAVRYAARADREVTVRLRWLINVLREVQPEEALKLDRGWASQQGARARVNRGDEDNRSPLAGPGRLERWQRQMAERLFLFLEPRLPQSH